MDKQQCVRSGDERRKARKSWPRWLKVLVGVFVAVAVLVPLLWVTAYFIQEHNWQHNHLVSWDPTPVIGADGRLYFITNHHELWCKTAANEAVWHVSQDLDGYWFSGLDVSADGTVYAMAYNGEFFSYDSQGRLRWNQLLYEPWYEFSRDEHS
ncbi:PQQ-like beta-propeller repeat protein [bacterium]|nr:PQQ-like beta-propeller repeat protein [bacterium]